MKPIKLNNQSEDETLVHFLQVYNPPAPLKDNCLEDKLINSISQQGEPQSTIPKKRKNLLLISTIITTALTILSGNALKNQLLPQSQLANELPELETFMVNSWNGAMAEDNQEMELYFATFEGEF